MIVLKYVEDPYNSLLSMSVYAKKFQFPVATALPYNSLLSMSGLVSFWIRIVTRMRQLFMLVGTGLIPVHWVL